MDEKLMKGHDMPDGTIAAPAELRQAFAAHLKSGAELLAAWKAGLSAEDTATVEGLEARGLRIGLSIAMPADHFVIHVFLLDPSGETTILTTIDQTGPLPSLN